LAVVSLRLKTYWDIQAAYIDREVTEIGEL
jgi:hypothetical protein